MSAPYAIFNAAPDKISNSTIGWESKVIFNFQFPSGLIVGYSDEILRTIINTGYNYKGSNILPIGYFKSPYVNTGKTLKITMHFRKYMDGAQIDFGTGFRSENLKQDYIVSSNGSSAVSEDGAYSHGVYETYITPMYYSSQSNYFSQVTGTATFQYASGGGLGGVVKMTPIWGTVEMNTNEELNIVIYNFCNGNDFYVQSLVIEEIG